MPHDAVASSAFVTPPPPPPPPAPPALPLSPAGAHPEAQLLGEPLLRISWSRAAAALRRYKWLAALIVVVGTSLGYVATRLATPIYAVNSTVWISNERNPDGTPTVGPIRAGEVLRETSWPDLLTSYAILDKVVRRMSLNLRPDRPADSVAFAGFETRERFRTGAYEVEVDESGWQYKLFDSDGKQLEAGIIGDSVGRKLGFRWVPKAAVFPRGRAVKFNISTPREAAISLRNNIVTNFPPQSNILRVTLYGSDPQGIAAVMNAVLEEFITAAGDLKKRSVTEAAKALAHQVEYAGKQLKEAEAALETFRVSTITLPTENTGQATGDGRSKDPVFDNYFTQRVESENLRRDRLALESTLALVRQGRLDPSAFWAVPATQNSAAPELKTALSEFAAKQASLRTAQRLYTNDHKVIRDLQSELDELRDQTIPRFVSALIAEQRRRELALDAQVAGTAQQLRAIPTRTTEETRLRREVETRGTLYTMLKNKYEEAKLAEATTVPDVSVLDSPVAPSNPLRDRAPFMIMLSVAASIAAAIALALVLDRFDRRFRYAEQATQELGLDIIGVVPALQQTAPALRDPIEAAHAREAFRSIRLAVMHAFDTSGRAMLTISSPGAGDGKSLLSSNLALSFADANCRTLLIDGDIRRGELHSYFGVERLPGFVDYLAGGLSLDKVLRKTHHAQLTLLPRGASQLHGPELLLSPAMGELMAELERLYDVIIVDSPPLGAGIDPFVLGTTTGSMLLVLRSGETDRRIAHAKLKVLNKLPVRLLGAVLNATRSESDLSYYSYLYSDAHDERMRQRKSEPSRDGTPPTAPPIPIVPETGDVVTTVTPTALPPS